MALNLINTRRPDGSYTITFTGTPVELNGTNSRLILSTGILHGIDGITSFSDEVAGQTSTTRLKKYFRYDNGSGMGDLIPIEYLTGTTISPCSDLSVDIVYVYVSDNGSTNQPITVSKVQFGGGYTMTTFDANAVIDAQGGSAVLSPYDVYKVFRLDGYQVLSNHSDFNILYRVTQDGGRTYTQYKPLTQDNIKVTRIDKLRFAQFEYHVTNNGSPLVVYDIILTGDFQNVNANYLKTNRYGLKEDCAKAMNGTVGSNMNALTDGISCYKDQVAAINQYNTDNASSLFKPYQFTELVSLANMLGNQVSSLAGWQVQYHLSDPDSGGIDTYIHEYTLKNVVDMKNIRIIVPENKFPTETVMINQFNLNLFDTFEVHVMKDEFKNAFGVTRRPSEDDYIYFCECNAIYTVKHAQAKRDIMNSSTFYRVILEKYEHRTNVRNLVKESSDAIKELTDNTTLDSLFGVTNRQEEANIANKEQFKPRSMDVVRHKVYSGVSIVDKTIIVDNFEPVKSYYDLSDKKIRGKVAVDYKKVDNTLGKADNRSFMFWVNFKNSFSEDSAVSQDVMNSYDVKKGIDFVLLDNYDAVQKAGYMVKYRGGMLHVTVGQQVHSVNCNMMTNVWYAVCISLDQVNQVVNTGVYKRDTDVTVTMFSTRTSEVTSVLSTDTSTMNELLSQGFVKVNNTESETCTNLVLVSGGTVDHVPVSYEHELSLKLTGSNALLTNIRVLSEAVPAGRMRDTLLEHVLADQKYIILADNYGKKITTTNYVNTNWE